MTNLDPATLRLKKLGIDTYTEAVIFIRQDSFICRSEGWTAQARVKVTHNGRSLIATLNTVETDLLRHNEASLSTYAWNFLGAKEGDEVKICHSRSLDSLSYIRSKVYGNQLNADQINFIIKDIIEGNLSDIHVAMFLTASAGQGLTQEETLSLTQAMINSGQILTWPAELIVDKHCIGGLPGNRTTLILVPIVAAFGLMIPKTSSRAITSPAGTADTMEVFAPVNLNLATMQKIIQKENGCIAWGGSVSLSPADDLLIRVERSMNLDSEGQMVASILSKKIAAGSNHLLIDIPIGSTVKMRSIAQAEKLKKLLETVSQAFSIQLKTVFSDGTQPIGRGIGPALEARDVLAVLKNEKEAPQDLLEHAVMLAGAIIEFSPHVKAGTGIAIARDILISGKAYKKFVAICEAQGGMFDIPTAKYQHTIFSKVEGKITAINCRNLSQLAKLAGAPIFKTSGVDFLVKLNMQISKDQPLFTVCADAKGELDYALSFLEQGQKIIQIEEQ